MHSEQFIGQRSCFSQRAALQISLEQGAQAFGIGVQIRNLPQIFDSSGNIAGLECNASAQHHGVAIARIEGKHSLQNFLGRTKRAASTQTFSRGGENLPRLRLLAQADVNLCQLHSHGSIFGVHFQRLLEYSNSLF